MSKTCLRGRGRGEVSPRWRVRKIAPLKRGAPSNAPRHCSNTFSPRKEGGGRFILHIQGAQVREATALRTPLYVATVVVFSCRSFALHGRGSSCCFAGGELEESETHARFSSIVPWYAPAALQQGLCPPVSHERLRVRSGKYFFADSEGSLGDVAVAGQPVWLSHMPAALLLRAVDANWILPSNMLPKLPQGMDRTGLFQLLPRTDYFTMGTGGKGNYLSIRRSQFRVVPASARVVYAAQGESWDAVVADLARPPRVSVSVHWHGCYVVISRARSLEGLLLLRLATRAELGKGAPEYLIKELDRLLALEKESTDTLQRYLRVHISALPQWIAALFDEGHVAAQRVPGSVSIDIPSETGAPAQTQAPKIGCGVGQGVTATSARHRSTRDSAETLHSLATVVGAIPCDGCDEPCPQTKRRRRQNQGGAKSQMLDLKRELAVPQRDEASGHIGPNWRLLRSKTTLQEAGETELTRSLAAQSVGQGRAP